jgi:hypothetical protein
VQRAHQNSLENQPIFLTLLTLSGLQYPVTAATFGGLYLAGRIGYVQVRSIIDTQFHHVACRNAYRLVANMPGKRFRNKGAAAGHLLHCSRS